MAIPNQNAAHFLLEGKDPSQVALRLLEADYTYGDLQSAAHDVARYLSEEVGHRGDRAILISDNSLFWVAAYLGTLQAGFVAVPLAPGISREELDYVLEITEPRIVFAQARLAARYGTALRALPLVTDCDVSGTGHAPPSRTLASLRGRLLKQAVALPVTPDDLAALMFTSGSTGRPRGVMVSHGNITANTASIIEYLELSASDRIMAVLPFHYCFGTSILHTHLRVGASLVIDLRFTYPEIVLQRMQDTQCTGFAGVPSHFQILLRKSSLKQKAFPHLRYVQQAGGHLAPVFVRELHEALPGTRIFVMYGQTEATARLAYLPPSLLEKKPGSIGKAIPGVQLRVLKESGEEVGPAEVGEIVAEGANIAHGYWRAPEETATSFRNGKLYTGDLATVDEEGFIYVVDRAKEFVKCGGRRVSCRLLEEQILELDRLLEAAVVAVPDDVLGEAVKAFVVPRHPESREIEEEIRLFCRSRMPYQLVPRDIVVLERLPTNSAGKVLKSQLKG